MNEPIEKSAQGQSHITLLYLIIWITSCKQGIKNSINDQIVPRNVTLASLFSYSSIRSTVILTHNNLNDK